VLQQEAYPAIMAPCWRPKFSRPWGYPPK